MGMMHNISVRTTQWIYIGEAGIGKGSSQCISSSQVTGLTVGECYNFKVVVSNSQGAGFPSAHSEDFCVPDSDSDTQGSFMITSEYYNSRKLLRETTLTNFAVCEPPVPDL